MPSTSSVRRSGGFAVVEVRDHGVGIAAEDLSIVFEAYTRLRQPQRATGLGLGLFVSREIVAAHGGDDHGDVADRRRDDDLGPSAGGAPDAQADAGHARPSPSPASERTEGPPS